MSSPQHERVVFAFVQMRAARQRVSCGSAPDPVRAPVPTNPATFDDAAWNLRMWVLQKWVNSEWDNQDIALLSYFISEAGGRGLSDFAVSPEATGGNYSAKVRSTLATTVGLNIDSDCFVIEDTPQWCKKTNARILGPMLMRLPHELLHLASTRSPQAYDMTAQDPDDVLVPSLTSHPICTEIGWKSCTPIGWYTDKVKYCKNDSFLRYSVGCTFIRERYTSAIVPGYMLCQCGCQGRCTTDHVLSVFVQSWNACQSGVHWKNPPVGHTWKERDKTIKKQKTKNENTKTQ